MRQTRRRLRSRRCCDKLRCEPAPEIRRNRSLEIDRDILEVERAWPSAAGGWAAQQRRAAGASPGGLLGAGASACGARRGDARLITRRVRRVGKGDLSAPRGPTGDAASRCARANRLDGADGPKTLALFRRKSQDAGHPVSSARRPVRRLELPEGEYGRSNASPFTYVPNIRVHVRGACRAAGADQSRLVAPRG